MTLFVSIFTLLFFVVLVGCGIFVNVYMYANGAFGDKVKRGRKLRLGVVSLSQTATMSTAAAAHLYPLSQTATMSAATAAAHLHPGRREHMSTYTRAFILSLGILLTLVALIVLVLGAPHF